MSVKLPGNLMNTETVECALMIDMVAFIQSQLGRIPSNDDEMSLILEAWVKDRRKKTADRFWSGRRPSKPRGRKTKQ